MEKPEAERRETGNVADESSQKKRKRIEVPERAEMERREVARAAAENVAERVAADKIEFDASD